MVIPTPTLTPLGTDLGVHAEDVCHADGDGQGLVVQRGVVEHGVGDEEERQRGEEGLRQHGGDGERAEEPVQRAQPVQVRTPQAALSAHVLRSRNHRVLNTQRTSLRCFSYVKINWDQSADGSQSQNRKSSILLLCNT